MASGDILRGDRTGVSLFDSELGSLLLDENKDDDDKKEILNGWGLGGIKFSSADEEEEELSRYIVANQNLNNTLVIYC